VTAVRSKLCIARSLRRRRIMAGLLAAILILVIGWIVFAAVLWALLAL
jgi:type IV secretory pathway TrbD component